jgi:hypothetical protein
MAHDDWNFILDSIEALFYRIALGIAGQSNISLADVTVGRSHP